MATSPGWKKDVANIMQRGGTILKTARSKEFMEYEGRKKAYETLMAHDIDGCIAIEAMERIPEP